MWLGIPHSWNEFHSCPRSRGSRLTISQPEGEHPFLQRPERRCWPCAGTGAVIADGLPERLLPRIGSATNSTNEVGAEISRVGPVQLTFKYALRPREQILLSLLSFVIHDWPRQKANRSNCPPPRLELVSKSRPQSAGPANRMRLPSGSRTMKFLAPQGSFFRFLRKLTPADWNSKSCLISSCGIHSDRGARQSCSRWRMSPTKPARQEAAGKAAHGRA